jgi:TolB-like protein
LKTKTCNIYRLFYILPFVLFLVVAWTAVAADKPATVAVLPFKINAEKDLSFLQNGITDMLTSRLTYEDQVEVIGRQQTATALETVAQPLNETKAQKIGTALGADYVLFGSITVFGNSVSMDAKLVDVSGIKPAMTFFNQSQGMDEVIPKIDQFATDINAKVFGRQAPTQQAAAPPQPVQQPAQQPAASQEQIDIHTHPEKLLAGEMADGEAPDSLFIPTQRPQEKSTRFWRSHSFNYLINGLALGDVNGDGKIETVAVSDNSLIIFQMQNNRLVKIAETAKTSSNHYIAVDVGDINGNGTPEIFITSLDAFRKVAKSLVVEYDGSSYHTIIDDMPTYFRVIHLSDQNPVLLGQRHEAFTDNVFGPAIFKLVWENAEYVPMDQVVPKRRANALGVAYGDVVERNDPLVVAFDDFDHLQVLEASGDRRWKGDEFYGGSSQYYITPQTDPDTPEPRKYYPMRLLLVDMDGNGIYEVLTAKNHELAGGRLSQFRHFTKTHFELLAWDGLGLASQWQTRQTSGQVRDFAIGDFDNDGTQELVAAIILIEGNTAFTRPKTAVIAYDLKPK